MVARALNLDPDRYSDKALALYEAAGFEVDMRTMDRQELEGCIGDYDLLILRFAHRLDADLLKRASRLQVIATNTTGVDHVDEDEAVRRGISLVCLRNEYEFLRSIHATAELTWALVIMLERRMAAAMQSVGRGEWSRDEFIGHELADQTIGIIGLGRIGEKIARYAQAFGMKVIAAETRDPAGDTGFPVHKDIEPVLEESDIVSIHLPYTAATRGLFDTRMIARMKPGARLINTSRGGIVDDEAIVAAIRSGQLGGYGTDVLSNELGADCPTGSSLWELSRNSDKVLITPHIGGAAVEAWEKTEMFVARKAIDEFKRRNRSSDEKR